MSRAYRNFWSLNTDEAVVAGILRSGTNKNIEVLMPLNYQMKGIDFVLFNVKTKRSLTIQVKGSKAFEPRPAEIKKWKIGSAGWFFMARDTIFKSSADYFVFIEYIIEESFRNGRRYIRPHIISIPVKEFKSFVRKYKKLGKSGKYNFLFWVNPKDKICFDYRDIENKERYFLTKFLDKNGLEKINFILK